MAIYVNGIKVAGRGISGKSPYQVAVSEGYVGTEAEFNAQLAAIGESVAGFNELSQQVANAKEEVEAAVEQADLAVKEALAQVEEAKDDLDLAIIAAKEEIDDAVDIALEQIPDAENLVTHAQLEDRLRGLDLSDYATISYVNSSVAGMATQSWTTTQVNNAVSGMATQTWVTTQINNSVTNIWLYGPDAPDKGKSGDEATKARKMLWIDSNTTTGGLKFYKNATDGWVHVPVAWQ